MAGDEVQADDKENANNRQASLSGQQKASLGVQIGEKEAASNGRELKLVSGAQSARTAPAPRWTTAGTAAAELSEWQEEKRSLQKTIRAQAVRMTELKRTTANALHMLAEHQRITGITQAPVEGEAPSQEMPSGASAGALVSSEMRLLQHALRQVQAAHKGTGAQVQTVQRQLDYMLRARQAEQESRAREQHEHEAELKRVQTEAAKTLADSHDAAKAAEALHEARLATLCDSAKAIASELVEARASEAQLSIELAALRARTADSIADELGATRAREAQYEEEVSALRGRAEALEAELGAAKAQAASAQAECELLCARVKALENEASGASHLGTAAVVQGALLLASCRCAACDCARRHQHAADHLLDGPSLLAGGRASAVAAAGAMLSLAVLASFVRAKSLSGK